MKLRSYHFRSWWEIPAAPEAVWQVLTETPFSWDKWWPELTEVNNLRRTTRLTGTSFSCTWRSPSGYRLKSDVVVKEIIPLERVVLSTTGDLAGTVTCRLRRVAGRTHIDIDWRVRTTKTWMNICAPLLKPLFVYSHHAVMRSGQRGLRSYMNGWKPAPTKRVPLDAEPFSSQL